jgi:hypothetical protein
MPPSIFARSSISDPPVAPYVTSSLNLAAAILAEDILIYVETVAKGHGCEFVFDDPHGIGPELQRKFKAGLFPKVNPMVFCEARSFLIASQKGMRRG